MLTHVHSLQRTQSQALRNKPVIRFHAGAESQREKTRPRGSGPQRCVGAGTAALPKRLRQPTAESMQRRRRCETSLAKAL